MFRSQQEVTCQLISSWRKLLPTCQVKLICDQLQSELESQMFGVRVIK